jgi:hypothetical protein
LKQAQEKYSYISDIDKIDFSSLINAELLNKDFLEKICKNCIDDFLCIFSKAKSDKILLIYNFIKTEDFRLSTLNNTYNGLKNGHLLLNNWKKITEICRSFII